MRVIAKNTVHDHLVDEFDHPNLSPGHVYVVVEIRDGDFRIINDHDEPILYPKALFDVVDSSIPSGWIFNDLEDDAYTIGPSDYSGPGFYEDYFDKEPTALAKFEVLKKKSETW